jgi:hypothetical protein
MAKRTRSSAARKGWETRRKKALSLAAKKGWGTRRRNAETRTIVAEVQPSLAEFVSDRRTGAHRRDVKWSHREWQRVRRLVRKHFGQRRFREVLEQIADAMGLDDSFVDALDESPDSHEA